MSYKHQYITRSIHKYITRSIHQYITRSIHQYITQSIPQYITRLYIYSIRYYRYYVLKRSFSLFEGTQWPWWYGSLIYLCKQYLLPLKLWVSVQLTVRYTWYSFVWQHLSMNYYMKSGIIYIQLPYDLDLMLHSFI